MPFRGQVAVAQVVINRVFSPFFPDDVCAVIYQNASHYLGCQFTFACDGRSKRIAGRAPAASPSRRSTASFT
jgi:spore germination cell wall hydrolase CwlJ-like protein